MFSSSGDSVAPAVVGAMITGWFAIQLDCRQAAMANALPALFMLLLLIFVVRVDREDALAFSRTNGVHRVP
jgi:hypothetical protein